MARQITYITIMHDTELSSESLCKRVRELLEEEEDLMDHIIEVRPGINVGEVARLAGLTN